MGCGCSTQGKRVAAAQKEKEHSTTVEAVQGAADMQATHDPDLKAVKDADPPAVEVAKLQEFVDPVMTPHTSVSAQQPTLALPPAEEEQREFLQGMSPPTPSGGGGLSWKSAPVTLGRLPRISREDPLPQLAPPVRDASDLPSVFGRERGLGPGLDIGFREEPTSIFVTTDAGKGERSSHINDTADHRRGIDREKDRPVEMEVHHQTTLDGGLRGSADVRRSSSSMGEALMILPVTPDGASDEGSVVQRRFEDRWPQDTSAAPGGPGGDLSRRDDGSPPPRQEARPATATETLKAAGSSSWGERGGQSIDSGLSVATGRMDSSEDGGGWGATSRPNSLLDADEEDFMETLLMES